MSELGAIKQFWASTATFPADKLVLTARQDIAYLLQCLEAGPQAKEDK